MLCSKLDLHQAGFQRIGKDNALYPSTYPVKVKQRRNGAFLQAYSAINMEIGAMPQHADGGSVKMASSHFL